MAQRRSRQNSSRLSESATDNQIVGRESRALIPMEGQKRSSYMMMTLLVMVMYSTWSVYYHQYQSLPTPLSAEQAGKRGFSELEALKHVEALSGLGPHPVGSDALAFAFQYVKTIAEKIQNASHWEVDVELDIFHVNAGANRLYRGLFMGKTLIYADMDHIVLRISPKYTPEAREQAILVSSHIDSVFSGGGAGDCSSCVAVMLEVARAMSQWAHGFKNSVIFLFNTGEEEGLNGAHSFVTQHLWSDTIRVAVDLEAMGIGGKSGVFQTGPDPWAVQNFALVAKYPSGQILAQDIFTSGAIKSATDFQVYMEYAGLSGLDFAYTDNTAVYHTKNDKLNLLTAGSLQHLGENMIAFLLHSASSTIPGRKDTDKEGTAEKDLAIYFDILGMYMVVYQQKFGSMLYNSVIMQSLLIWALSLLMGGVHAAVSLALSCLSLLLMWIFSLSSSIFVAFLLPLVSASSVPYVASPWLVVGLFGAPALLGALSGQHIGFRILKAYLFNAQTKKSNPNLSLPILANLAELEAERWLFKSGLVQCLLLLILANYYKIGTAYLPLIWLVSPAFAYGLLEATLSPVRLPKPLKIATLVIGYSVPILVSGGSVVRVMGILIGTLVRIDRNPGGTPEWLGNIVVSVLVAAVICLMLVYLLSYVHLSGGKRSIVGAGFVLFGLSVTSLWAGFVPPYTEDFARALNVVHVVETTGSNINRQDPIAYVSLSSSTPGKLTQEVELVGEGFVCNNMTTDFVSFSVKYGCRTYDDAESGWSKMDLPSLQVEGDEGVDGRVTKVSVDTKSSKRWCLAVNMREVEDFEFEGDYEELAVPLGYKGSIDGWHQIQFSGGKKAPTKFTLTLHWARNSSQDSSKGIGGDQHPLLKLRTDVDRLTPKVENVMKKLPPWSASFGKSTSPFNLAFLTNLPVEF